MQKRNLFQTIVYGKKIERPQAGVISTHQKPSNKNFTTSLYESQDQNTKFSKRITDNNAPRTYAAVFNDNNVALTEDENPGNNNVLSTEDENPGDDNVRSIKMLIII